MNIYVGNLSWGMTDDSLNAIFSKFGTVNSAKIIIDKMSGRSKGFGFVEMSDDSEAKAAIAALNETELEGRNIVVNESKPREEGSGGYKGGGGGYKGGGGGYKGGNGGGYNKDRGGYGNKRDY
jgi:RNA recognition motif-containing protein